MSLWITIAAVLKSSGYHPFRHSGYHPLSLGVSPTRPNEIEAQGYPQPAIFPINFESATSQDYLQLKTALEQEFAAIDGLLHNAGMLGPKTNVEQYSSEQWQSVFNVNCHAPFLLTQTLLPLLKQSKQASVVFTSSGVAQRGRAYWGAYAASKAAQDNLMQTLADEYDDTPSVRFNSINPGATRTAMRATAYPAESPDSLPSPEAHAFKYAYLFADISKGANGLIFCC